MSHRARRETALLSFLLLLIPPLLNAADGCKLRLLGELPVTMNGLRPTVEAQINGNPALFTLDSGAFWSILSPATAQQYQLHLNYARLPGLYIGGVGGSTEAALTIVKTFTIFNAPLHNVEFVVGGGEFGAGTVGLLGQNILRVADVEYDLAQGKLRLFKPEGCKNFELAYWAKADLVYNEMDIEPLTADNRHTQGMVELNGKRVRVAFDTGAVTSIVGLRAAAAAGFKPGDPRVERAGYGSGIGREIIETWIATFPVFEIGQEEVHNARLRFGDLGSVDMLLGEDFFLSHRIYVANSQHKLYFTYNGGPVFALTAPANAAATATSSAIEDEDAAIGMEEPLAGDSLAGPVAAPTAASYAPEAGSSSAGDLARRGAALAARRDFEHALQEFNRACELAPGEAACFYQRALTEFALRQSDPAGKDLDRALALKPDYVDALVTRARYRRSKLDTAAALADLDAADHAAAKEADVRLTLAGLYASLERQAQAIAQADLWIAVHEQDPRLAQAYYARCWARAMLGQELDAALRDCNAGLRLSPHAAQLLDGRGLVHLRANRFDKAIADYDEALKLNPKIAWALYGRGIAEQRKGLTAQAEADIAAAKAIAPHLPQTAQRIGLNP